MKIHPLLTHIDSHDFLSDYLTQCGVKDVDEYLHADLSICDSPWDYPNMMCGVNRLKRALDLNQKIGIIVDEDHDGYTSASIMYMFIKKMNPDHDVVPLFHKSKAHGIVVNKEENMVREAINQGIKLLICPDSASNDDVQAHELRLNGVCCLILDHHEVNKIIHYGILINHHEGNGLNVHLSGCGVTHKFILACAETWGVDLGDSYYDLVASSIVSDNCSMVTPENLALIRYGFTHMTNPMLIAMYDKFNRRGNSPIGVAWGTAPHVNAITRAGTMEEKHLLFKAFVGEADIDEAIKMATAVHKRQSDAVKQLVKEIEPNIDDSHKVLIGFSDAENKNYSGLVANKLTGAYGKPTLILRPMGDKKWSGSLRSPVDIADKINATNLAFCQGHKAACGIYIWRSNLKKLIKWFDKSKLDMEPSKEVASVITPSDIKLPLCHACSDDMLLWGGSSAAKVVQPKFFIEFDSKPSDVVVFAKRTKTVRFNFPNGSSMLKFMAKSEDIEMLQEQNCHVQAIVTLSVNEWNGTESAQCQVEEWEIGTIEESEENWEDIF